MSWSISVAGRAGTIASQVKSKFETTGGCPAGTAEEAAKNAIGAICESLAKTLPPDKVVRVTAQGSAWNVGDGAANSQQCEFKFSTMGEWLEEASTAPTNS